MALFFRKIYDFYRRECCWPYALSFFLVLVIYWLDFSVERNQTPWASFISYAVIFSYYIYNLYFYVKSKIFTKAGGFFIGFLSAKILLWGLLLFYLTRRLKYA